MDRQKQIALLNADTKRWKAWIRTRFRNRKIDLNGMDLRGKDFSGADLSFANLSEALLADANLSDADLSGANLRGADLKRANLWSTNFIEADLSKCDLSEAELTGALFSDADLSEASLYRARCSTADFGRANLTKANLGLCDLDLARFSATILDQTIFAESRFVETIFCAVDLSTTKGLETCEHSGPSLIDFQTLKLSGSLPLDFLRGVGLSDPLIDYLPALLCEAIQMYSCFISYSSKDHMFAERLHADLQANGARCWFAPHDLPIGGKTWDAIDEAIRLRDKLLLIISKNSIRSDWVEDEVSKAFAEERKRNRIVLFPIRIDESIFQTTEPWAIKLRDQRNIGDFKKWKRHDDYKRSLNRLLRDLTV